MLDLSSFKDNGKDENYYIKNASKLTLDNEKLYCSLITVRNSL